MPSSVGVGTDVARSATICVPSPPPTRLKATRPSLVMLRIGHDSGEYAIPGSTASIGSDVRTRSVPPRCALVAPWPETQMPPLAAATPPGRLRQGGAVGGRGARRESLRVSCASPAGAPKPPPAVTATAFGDAPTG